MLKENGIKGSYLEYKGRPLVRQDKEIYFGDMSDDFYVFMMIMSTKKLSDRAGTELPDKVLVQLLPKDGSKPEKQRMANGLYDAFETACAWLPD